LNNLLNALRQLTAAVHSSPEGLQAQQTHQASNIPTLRSSLEEILYDLTEQERSVLVETINGIDDDPLPLNENI